MWRVASHSNGAFRLLDRALARHRADRKLAVLFSDISEIGNAIEIHDQRRPAQAKVEEGHQALATGQQLGVGPAVAQRIEDVVDGRRSAVVEPCRFHGFSLSAGCPRLARA
jgi:hypothetical protein